MNFVVCGSVAEAICSSFPQAVLIGRERFGRFLNLNFLVSLSSHNRFIESLHSV